MFPLIDMKASLLLFIENPRLLDFLPVLIVLSNYCSNVVLFSHWSTDILDYAHPRHMFHPEVLKFKDFFSLTMVTPSLFLTAA